MKINLTIWHLIMTVIVTLLSACFFEIVNSIVFKSANIIFPENISQSIAMVAGALVTIFGVKKAFDLQLEKVCRENFLAYRINLNTFLSKFN